MTERCSVSADVIPSDEFTLDLLAAVLARMFAHSQRQNPFNASAPEAQRGRASL
jgi:hypothetical protein